MTCDLRIIDPRLGVSAPLLGAKDARFAFQDIRMSVSDGPFINRMPSVHSLAAKALPGCRLPADAYILTIWTPRNAGTLA
jgi:hypothetical protein